ncbi:MAG: hypothetical protein ACPG08_06510 [Flavobacteriales bacterium]
MTITAALVVGMLLLNSCGSRHFWKGLRMSEKELYTEAAANLHRALAKWPNDTMSYRLLGQTQMNLMDFAAAERTYEELGYRTILTADDQLNYAKCMMQQGKYAEASDVLEWLMVEDDAPEYVKRVWDRCTSQLHVDEDTRHWQISPLHFPGLETASAPRISENRLYFCSEPYQWGQADQTARLDRNEIWFMDLGNSSPHVMRAKEVNAMDLPDHHGIISLSPDGRSIAYSKKNNRSIGWFGDPVDGGYQLLIASRTATGEWGESRPFPFVEKGYIFAHPTWSPDGNRLYFATDLPSPEAQGGMDIWVSERNGTFWEEPLNLGPEVNSAGDDVFPAFDSNGRLYFASDGHPTLGGLDIFWTEIDPTAKPETRHWRDGDAWKTPVRMAFPINSLADDYAFAIESDGTHGFICSNRAGFDEVFRVEHDEDVAAFNVVVTDYATGEALPRVPIRWIDLKDGSAWDTRTSLDGTLSIDLPPNRGFQVTCALPGYLVTRKFITTDVTEPVWEVELAKIKALNDKRFADRWMGGTPFEIAGLEWEAEAQMTRASEVNLYDLVDFLKLNPEVFLEIRTHEDASAWDLFDQPTNRTSKMRSIEIESFLLKAGVSPKQLISVGKGIDELRNGCLPGEPCAFYNHEDNDRTEFRIYGLLQQTPGQIDPVPFTKSDK